VHQKKNNISKLEYINRKSNVTFLNFTNIPKTSLLLLAWAISSLGTCKKTKLGTASSLWGKVKLSSFSYYFPTSNTKGTYKTNISHISNQEYINKKNRCLFLHLSIILEK
jgi:hypothetical protein